MKYYTFGNEARPVLLLLPGTCMNWRANFGHAISELQKTFCVVCVSYDGFNETEDTIFPDIIEADLKHEELLISYLDKWVEEVKRVTNMENDYV